MTLTVDPNRIHWAAVGRDEPSDWAGLATEPDGIEERLRARDQGFPPPASLLLMSAWTDLAATGASYDRKSMPMFVRAASDLSAGQGRGSVAR